jgi:hypothetical protein
MSGSTISDTSGTTINDTSSEEYRLGWILLRPDFTFCVGMGEQNIDKSKASSLAQIYSKFHEENKTLEGYSFLYFVCSPKDIEMSDFLHPVGYVQMQACN